MPDILTVIIFLLGLPVSVWVWANIYAIIDETDRAVPLVRLAATGCVILAGLLLIGRTYVWPLLAAWITIMVIYVGVFYAYRHLALGVEQHTDRPVPFLTDELTRDEEEELDLPDPPQT